MEFISICWLWVIAVAISSSITQLNSICLNKKNALIPFVAEVDEINEEGSNELRINDSLTLSNQWKLKLNEERAALTPARMILLI